MLCVYWVVLRIIRSACTHTLIRSYPVCQYILQYSLFCISVWAMKDLIRVQIFSLIWTLSSYSIKVLSLHYGLIIQDKMGSQENIFLFFSLVKKNNCLILSYDICVCSLAVSVLLSRCPSL